MPQDYFNSSLVQSRTPLGSPESSTTYQTGRGAVSDALRQQSRRDSAQAAARGLGSNEAALAMQGNRQQSMVDAIRQLLADGQREQERQQMFTEQSRMNRARFAFDQDRWRTQREDERRRRRSSLLAGLVQGGMGLLGTALGGPLGGALGNALGGAVTGGGGGQTQTQTGTGAGIGWGTGYSL